MARPQDARGDTESNSCSKVANSLGRAEANKGVVGVETLFHIGSH